MTERQARRTRPQLVCVLADNSSSMNGVKAEAATDGIRDLLMHLQTTGPKGRDRSYFQFLLIQFDSNPTVFPNCDMVPVRSIDAADIEICGDGGMTNITGALELAYVRLKPYMDELQSHPECDEHPIPLVLLFSDGQHNLRRFDAPPGEVAGEIKKLGLGGLPVNVATIGISIDGDSADNKMLESIASPNCFVEIEDADRLRRLIAEVASAGLSRTKDIARLMCKRAED